MSSEQPNGNPDAASETSIETTSGTSSDMAIGRFRDAVESLKEPRQQPVVAPVDSMNRPEMPLKSVVAEQFVLVDSHGAPRATLTLDDDGGPALALNDANGRTRAAIGLDGNGAPSVVLYDTIGRRRIEIALKADGSAGLGIYNEAGEGRAELVVNGSGAPGLSLFGPDGKRLAKLPTGRER